MSDHVCVRYHEAACPRIAGGLALPPGLYAIRELTAWTKEVGLEFGACHGCTRVPYLQEVPRQTSLPPRRSPVSTL